MKAKAIVPECPCSKVIKLINPQHECAVCGSVFVSRASARELDSVLRRLYPKFWIWIGPRSLWGVVPGVLEIFIYLDGKPAPLDKLTELMGVKINWLK